MDAEDRAGEAQSAARVLVAGVRDHYVAQFRGFVARELEASPGGASELKIKLKDDGELFNQLYCVDFYRGSGGAAGGSELEPTHLTFPALKGKFGQAALSLVDLRWSDVLIRHDLAQVPADAMLEWFRWWFDPANARRDPAAELSGNIHSMLVQPGAIFVDFGTTDPGAFWSLLELLEAAGASNIVVGSSKAAVAGAA